jgi:DNA-binding NtrC family response regulator
LTIFSNAKSRLRLERLRGFAMTKPSSMRRDTGAGAPPSQPTQEFLELLAFDFDEALIWLGDRRMMMIDVTFFGELRRQLIDAAGIEQANRMFARIGYESGLRDSKLLLDRWPEARTEGVNATLVSPHRFQGFTKLTVVSRITDDANRLVSGEWQWEHSAEADAHVGAYGRAMVPTCWMEIGYATGYSYGLYGIISLFREVGCRAMGNRLCTVVGRTPEPSDDIRPHLVNLEFLEPLIIEQMRGSRAPRPAPAPARANTVIKAGEEAAPDGIVGRSPALTIAKRLLQSVAATDATVLISGESGVGKELFTRHLHGLSKRAAKPLVAVNCAAIPDTLVEAELFGVERGAFTGATESRAGRFERAQGGTLFLDEIGSLHPAAQVKLLRAIQEREIERIGGTKPIKLDVRIVAANNVPLRELVAKNEFREDLFYRLNVFPIHVPPLRERREDIPDLMKHYLGWYNRIHGRSIASFTFEATKALLSYSYPGNIRELQNLIERAVILTEGDSIDVYNLFAYGESLTSPSWSFDASGALSTDDQQNAVSRRVAEFGDEMLRLCQTNESISWPALEEQLFASISRKILADSRGNVSSAARRLGMQRHQLEYRLKRAGPAPRESSDEAASST